MPTTCNIRQFQAALKEKQRLSGKTASELLNKAARDVVFRAASFTERTTAAKIRAKLMLGGLVFKIAAKRLRGRGRFTRADVEAEAKRILNTAARAAGSVRASWAPAIIALGGSYRGRRPSPGTESAKGLAKRATPWNLVALVRSSIVTTSGKGRVTGASQIPPLTDGLNRAVAFVTRDIKEYAVRKFAKAMKKK